ncbi:MAG: flagellar biosynthesis protein FlgA, partial [Chloroflexi bacterium]|nr:flagellar biosynthesis protein FlgA [Chloroflexota bacterium]
SLAEALATGATYVGDDASALIAADGLDLVVEATGVPAAGVAHCLLAIDYGRHIVMVNVEADALAGPILARRAAEAGLVYSLAYGDQPALIAELVEWARAAGFEVVCAGKGTKYLPIYHQSTPDTVWTHYGFSPEQVARGGFNPQMFNSFLDGTKSAIEMAAVANACGLTPQPEGLRFPPCGVDDLPHICRPAAEGGQLAHAGTVEVVSSLERDGRPVYRDLRWGVYVTFAAPDEYVRQCFAEYGLLTDASGRYTALYRPYHLIGLELTVSVLRVGLRGEPTGRPAAFRGDVAAVAKRDLAAGEHLDGEGGYTVYGALVPAASALQRGLLPIGLAHGLTLRHAIPAGQALCWDDVSYEPTNPTVRMRRLMERTFAAG